MTFTQTTALAVDPTACTETLQAVAAPISGIQASFARVGAPSANIAMIENVQVFPNEKAAAKRCAADKTNHAARLKCGTVAFIPQGSTTAGGTTAYRTAEFPKVGTGSYLETTGTPGTPTANAAVTFLSGPYVVRLGIFGGTNPLTTADLQKIALRALKHVRQLTPIAGTTTTK